MTKENSSPLVSCMICQAVKTAKGIHSHYLHLHSTVQDKEKMQKGSKKNHGHIKQKQQALNKRQEYIEHPSYCRVCECCLPYSKRHKSFCSSSCSATFNNTKRIHSDESNQKRSKSLKNGLSIRKNTRRTKHHITQDIVGPFTKIYLCKCKYTGKIWYSKTRKTVSPDYIESKKAYSYQCRFNFGISSYPEWFSDASELINKYGWYSTPGSTRTGTTNTNGISRDHIISVSYGFEHSISPEILSHPANCQLVPHKKNQNKGTKCGISLDELMKRIDKFDKMYPGKSAR